MRSSGELESVPRLTQLAATNETTMETIAPTMIMTTIFGSLKLLAAGTSAAPKLRAAGARPSTPTPRGNLPLRVGWVGLRHP